MVMKRVGLDEEEELGNGPEVRGSGSGHCCFSSQLWFVYFDLENCAQFLSDHVQEMKRSQEVRWLAPFLGSAILGISTSCGQDCSGALLLSARTCGQDCSGALLLLARTCGQDCSGTLLLSARALAGAGFAP